jgi:hypothetical protein
MHEPERAEIKPAGKSGDLFFRDFAEALEDSRKI